MALGVPILKHFRVIIKFSFNGKDGVISICYHTRVTGVNINLLTWPVD